MTISHRQMRDLYSYMKSQRKRKLIVFCLVQTSTILARLKKALGPNPSKSNCRILRSIWLQKLPARTREFLVIYQDDLHSKRADIADRLFEQYEKP